MRAIVSATLAALASCSSEERLFVPFAPGPARAAVFVLHDVTPPRAIAVDVEALASATIELPPEASVELTTFAQDLDALRLDAAPAVLSSSRCPADELSTAEGLATRCLADGSFGPCERPPVLLAQRPYLGVSGCAKWAFDEEVALVRFNLELEPASGLRAPVVVELGGDRVLLGQHVRTGTRTRTALQVLDGGAVGPIRFEGPAVLAPGDIVSAAPRDEHTIWVQMPWRQVSVLDVRTGSITSVLEPAPADVLDLSPSPYDREALLATTRGCGLLERAGRGWRTLVEDLPGITEDEGPCLPTVTWVGPGEALIAGVVVDPGRGNELDLDRDQQRVRRYRAGRLAPEALSWDPAWPYGHPTASGSYLAGDGTRVELVVARRHPEPIDTFVDVQDVWFVNDPRRGDGWRLLTDPDLTQTYAPRRILPWGDGAVLTGGYRIAFSDRHWRAEPDAALSKRVGETLLGLSAYDAIAADGHGGFVVGRTAPDEASFAFGWWRAAR